MSESLKTPGMKFPEPWTDEQIDEAAMEEYLGVVARLWTAVGKAVDAERLAVYRKALGEIPLGLLELAIDRVIRELTYPVVPLPGAVWEAVRKELGNPWDVRQAMDEWVERRWERVIYRFDGKQVAYPCEKCRHGYECGRVGDRQ